jgi:hypothetical protein
MWGSTSAPNARRSTKLKCTFTIFSLYVIPFLSCPFSCYL